MRKNLLAAIVLLVLYIPSVWAAAGYPVRGRVIDRLSREPVAYAAVTITGQPGKGAMTDSLGRFEILQVKPGIYSLTASFIGYRTVVTPEYQVSARTPFIEIEMEEEPEHLNEVVVRPSPFRRTIESPVSMQVIGMREIEKTLEIGRARRVPAPIVTCRVSFVPIQACRFRPSVIATT